MTKIIVISLSLIFLILYEVFRRLEGFGGAPNLGFIAAHNLFLFLFALSIAERERIVNFFSKRLSEERDALETKVPLVLSKYFLVLLLLFVTLTSSIEYYFDMGFLNQAISIIFLIILFIIMTWLESNHHVK